MMDVSKFFLRFAQVISLVPLLSGVLSYFKYGNFRLITIGFWSSCLLFATSIGCIKIMEYFDSLEE